MEQPTLYYTITSFEQALKYTNNTILFTLRDSKLILYESLETALEVMPHPCRGPLQKIPLIAKFEVNEESERPETISAACLTQFGYKEGRVKLALEGSSRTHKMRLQGVSVVPVDDIKTDITEKLEYFEKLRQYKQKVERYTESQTEIVHPSGAIDAEFIRLQYTEFEPLLGGRLGHCKDDEIVAEYGITLDEAELLHETRGAVVQMGKAFTQGLKKLKGRRVVVPGTEDYAEIGEAAQRFLMLNELLAKGNFKIRVQHSEPDYRIEDHLKVMSALAGFDLESLLQFMDETGRRRLEDG